MAPATPTPNPSDTQDPEVPPTHPSNFLEEPLEPQLPLDPTILEPQVPPNPASLETQLPPTPHSTPLTSNLRITTLPPAPQAWSSDSLQEGVGVRLSRAPTIPQLDGAGVSPAPPAPSAPSNTNTTPPPPRYVPPYRRNEAKGLWTEYVDDD